MMENRAAALRVGGFVAVAVAALLGIVFFLSGSALDHGTPYETYFQESVQGLDIGTAVKYRGVTIGKITDIGLVSAEYPPPSRSDLANKVWRQVIVRFKVSNRKLGEVPNIDQAVKLGLRVQIAPQGITGLAYLELSFVNPAQYPVQAVPWTPDDPVIPSIPSTLTQVQDAAERVFSALSKLDLGTMATNINALVQSLTQEITTGDVHQSFGNINALLLTLNSQIKAAKLPETTADIRDLANGQQTQQILARLDQASANLAKVTAALPQLVAASQGTIGRADEATADLQQQTTPLLQNLATTTQNLRDLTATLSRNPGAVLAPPPPRGDGR
jgi:phospholipid/cholesterol/gamma-HCH transport system substrate-binding protein